MTKRRRFNLQFGLCLSFFAILLGRRFLLFPYPPIPEESHTLFVSQRNIGTTSIALFVNKSIDGGYHSDAAMWTEVLRHGVIARAYNWSRPIPCFKPDSAMKMINGGYRQPGTNGVMFMKLMKTGGSTATGITMRIAKHTAMRNDETFWICRGRWDHNWAYDMLEHRLRNESFTWTLIRNPTKRIVSEFYHFEVSRENRSTSYESFAKYVEVDRRAILTNYYLRVLSIKKIAISDSYAPSVINDILSDYDFIGITERMDESAVALMMLLRVPIGDILYLDAKGNGGYDDGIHLNTCYFIQRSKVTPKMKELFRSPFWKNVTKWDNLLYKAANRSLDLTIDRLGRDAFADNLAKFQHANKMARERCLTTEIFPCTSTGEKNPDASCLWSDSGCGYQCLNQIAEELGIS